LLQYREAVCLLWAVYFCSLSPDSKLNLGEMSPEDGISGPHKIYEPLLTSGTQAGHQVNKLYSGSLVYQIIGDQVSIKDRKHFIPSFGTVIESDQSLIGELQKQYIGSARKLGMSLLEELGLVRLFPKVRSFLNRREFKRV